MQLFSAIPSQAGYVHMLFKRMAFVGFVQGMVAVSKDAYAGEVRDKVMPQMAGLEWFAQTFAQGSATEAPAAVG